MRDARIGIYRAEVKEEPERNADQAEENAGGKKDAERLPAELRQRTGPSALVVRWRCFHDCSMSGAVATSNFCVVKAKLRVSANDVRVSLKPEGNTISAMIHCITAHLPRLLNLDRLRLALRLADPPRAEDNAAHGEGEERATHVDQNERPGICFEG